MQVSTHDRPTGVDSRLRGNDVEFDDRLVRDLPDLLRPGDALVFNDTRVIRAALQGERVRGENRAVISFNLHKRIDESRWRAFARPAKRLAAGDRIRFGHDGRVCLLGTLDATVSEIGEAGEVELSFSLHGAYLDEAIAALGDPPLPPYIAAKRGVQPEDAERYQTVYARHDGAVAAPTAGLHFTPALLAALDARGISRHYVTLHVGAGTFLPVKAEDTAGHRMHAEWGEISAETAAALNCARARRCAHRRRRHHLAAAAGDGGGRRRHHPAVRRRNRDLHHARLPLQGHGSAADQLSFAALDAVHAGGGLQRARHHARRLRARDPHGLSLLFLRRRLSALSGAGAAMTDRFAFTLRRTDGGARLGEIATPRGLIRTPAFMPVGTAATVKALYTDQLEAAGTDIVLANTYHLMLRPGAERVARLGGLHRFMRWKGPIITDSGGFQVMSLSKLRKITDAGVTFQSHIDGSTHSLTPERAVEIQCLLGSDIQMQLDECIALPATAEETRVAVDRSLAWAIACQARVRAEPGAGAGEARAGPVRHRAGRRSTRNCGHGPLTPWWRWTCRATASAASPWARRSRRCSTRWS